MLDLESHYAEIRDELRTAIDAVLDSQQFILGPAVKQLERLIADYSQCAHGIGVSSGTDALLVALMAENIGPGDEVITTPYTFFATAGCVSRVGATPVFVDICPDTYNLDVSQIEVRISARTKAILPVHLFGQCADMDPVLDIAQRYGLIVIEDAAQAIGAEYHGRRAGSMGHYGCFSFFPSKNLGAAGDGGMIVTQCGERAERVRVLRSHGAKPKYYHQVIGGNFRLDALQAAVVQAKFPRLDRWTQARQQNAERYRKLFQQAGLLAGTWLTLPTSMPHNRHVFNQFVIRTPLRDALQQYLKQSNVETQVYYPVPMHLQHCFAYLGYHEGDFPQAEAAAKQSLALPIYAELSDAQAQYVVGRIAGFFEARQAGVSRVA
jgi:dTDP-4-amino-4,6-dideoxygalactose transaminase